MTIFGYWGKGLKFLVAFLISYGWLTFNVRHGINIPSPMLFTFLIELIPVFMAVYLVSQAPSGKRHCCPPATAASVLRKADGDCHTAFCSNGGFGVF